MYIIVITRGPYECIYFLYLKCVLDESHALDQVEMIRAIISLPDTRVMRSHEPSAANTWPNGQKTLFLPHPTVRAGICSHVDIYLYLQIYTYIYIYIYIHMRMHT